MLQLYIIMGLTNIATIIADLTGKKKVSGNFLVDTGAAYTVVPKEMVGKLNLKPDRIQEFSLADGTIVSRKLGSAVIEIDGKKAASTVVLGEKDDSPLLGVITLENMGLMVDPFSRKLRPMKLMLA